jgi:hypothetical protein
VRWLLPWPSWKRLRMCCAWAISPSKVAAGAGPKMSPSAWAERTTAATESAHRAQAAPKYPSDRDRRLYIVSPCVYLAVMARLTSIGTETIRSHLCRCNKYEVRHCHHTDDPGDRANSRTNDDCSAVSTRSTRGVGEPATPQRARCGGPARRGPVCGARRL